MTKGTAREVVLPSGWLRAAWAVPSCVAAFVTTRAGGVSQPPYGSLNLGLHVGDAPESVQENRNRLMKVLPSGTQLQWLEQVHGTSVVDACADGFTRTGDAVYVDRPGLGGVVMTADCLPVFFASSDGRRAALAHAGWRGLLEGVLESTVARFPDVPAEIHAWLGPAIGPCHFEVGQEVLDAFVATASLDWEETKAAFVPTATAGKYLADIYRLARLRLRATGVLRVSGGGMCTVCESSQYFSYRRDGVTGRFASVVALLT